MGSSSQRLGEILLHDQVITRLQLNDALKNQVVYGGRLGTNLIELGYADHDQIAKGLAQRHRVPAALTKHLANSDPSLRRLLPAEVAGRCLAFPIARLRGAADRVAVCFRDPEAGVVGEVARHLQCQVLASVAAEAALLYWLERSYGLPRPQRYAFSAPGQVAPLPRTSDTMRVAISDLPQDDDDSIDIDIDEPETLPDQFQLVDLDDVSVNKDDSPYRSGVQRVSAILEAASSSESIDLAAAAQQAAAMAAEAAAGAVKADTDPAERQPRPTPAARKLPRPDAVDLHGSLHRIAAAADRVAVSDAILGYMATSFDAGLIMVVKGELALGYRGFGGNFDHHTVESIVVPLKVPSIFQLVADTRETFNGQPPQEAHAVQRRFFVLFSAVPDSVVLVPIKLRSRLVCMIYGHPPAGREVDASTMAELEQVATAAEQAFLRLIRAAKREA